MAERHPSRTLLLVPRPDEADGLDARALGPVLPGRRSRVCGEVIELDAARRAGGGAGVDRAAAADLGPAGVLPLARRAAVRVDRARAAGRGHRPAGRRLDGVGRTCPVRTRSSRSSSTGARSRTSRGRARSAGASLLASLWPGIADVQAAARPRHARAGRICCAGWLRSRLGHDVELELDERETARGHRPRRRSRAAFPPGAPPNAERRPLAHELDQLRPRPRLRAGRASAAAGV